MGRVIRMYSVSKAKSQEIIRTLCKTHTSLSEEEIQTLLHVSEKLEDMSRKRNADVFIDCPCENEKEAIVVAQATRENSLYEFSTIGYVIREKDEPAVFRSLRYGVKTDEVTALTQAATDDNYVVQRVIPIKSKGKTIGVLIFERSYDRNMRQSMPTGQLPLSRRSGRDNKPPYLDNLEWICECVSEGILVLDMHEVVRFHNTQAMRIYREYGYVTDILNRKYWEISLHGKLRVSDPQSDAYYETELSLRSGYYAICEYRVGGDETFYVVVIRNLSEQKLNEERMQIKTAAVREVHHRIKNGLHTVYSLLDMQKRRVSTDEVADILQDAMNRIMSIATTYETLIDGDADTVDIREVICNIKDQFLRVASRPGRDICISVQGAGVNVRTELAESVALVVNELIQNAYKHAFVNREQGNIRIDISHDPLYTTIVVEDDGAGFAQSQPHNNEGDRGGFGLQMARMLVRNKLHGRLDISSSAEGTRVTFDFVDRNNEK